MLSVYSKSINFILRNFSHLFLALLFPFFLTLMLIAVLLVFTYDFLMALPGMIGLVNHGAWLQGLILGAQTLAFLAMLFLSYFLFMPLWQLLVMPFMEGFSLKVCRIYCKEHGFIIKERRILFWRSLFEGTRISISLFLRQMAFRSIILLLIFFYPVLGVMGILFEFVANYLFSSYEYLFVPINAFKGDAGSLNRLKSQIVRLKIPFFSFRTCSAILLTIPIINIFAIVLNCAASSIIFCEYAIPSKIKEDQKNER